MGRWRSRIAAGILAGVAVAALGGQIVKATIGARLRNPRMVLTPPLLPGDFGPKVTPGQTVIVAVAGFGSDEPIDFRFDSRIVTSGTTSSLGTAVATVIVPETEPGLTSHLIQASTALQSVSERLDVGSDWSNAQSGFLANRGPNGWIAPADLASQDVLVGLLPGTRLNLTIADGLLLHGSLSAIDATTGRERWSVAVASDIVPECSRSYPGLCEAAAVTALHGVVYAYYSEPFVAAFNLQTGALLWHTRLMSPGTARATLAVSDGVLHVTDGYAHFALNPGNGQLLWSGRIFSSIETRVAAGVVLGTKVDTASVTRLLALNAADGATAWTSAVSAMAGTTLSTPAVASTTAYLGASDGRMYALDLATGRTKWSVTVPGVRFEAAPAVDGAVTYWQGNDTLYARSATTGAAIWQVATPPLVPTTAPVVANGVLYVGTTNGVVTFDASNGSILFTSRCNVGPVSSIAIASGTVYDSEGDGGICTIYKPRSVPLTRDPGAPTAIP